MSDLQRFIDRLEQTSGKRKEAGLAMDFQREQHRIFAVNENGTVIAEITFPEREKGVYVIDHTFVDESLRGQGVAKVLMEMAIAQIKEQKGKVEATCSYAQRFLEKHPQ